MDIYKQICAKLVEAWDDTADGEYEDFGRAASYLVDWTRAALAEPELEGPTREQSVAIYSEVMATHECQTLGEMAEYFARAVLARWGSVHFIPNPVLAHDPFGVWAGLFPVIRQIINWRFYG